MTSRPKRIGSKKYKSSAEADPVIVASPQPTRSPLVQTGPSGNPIPPTEVQPMALTALAAQPAASSAATSSSTPASTTSLPTPFVQPPPASATAVPLPAPVSSGFLPLEQSTMPPAATASVPPSRHKFPDQITAVTSESKLINFDPQRFIPEGPVSQTETLVRSARESADEVSTNAELVKALEEFFVIIGRSEDALLANSQDLRNILTRIQSDLPAALVVPLYNAAELDKKKVHIDAARERKAERQKHKFQGELVKTHASACDILVADIDRLLEQNRASSSKRASLQAKKAELLKQLEAIEGQLCELDDLPKEIEQKRKQVVETLTAMRTEQAKIPWIGGTDEDDDGVINSAQEVLRAAHLALCNALGKEFNMSLIRRRE